MAKITSVKTSADNNKLFTAQVNDDNTREFKEYDITTGINNKTLQDTADVTSFDEGMDVITVNPSGDKFVGVDRRGREVINLETSNNFSVNSFNLLNRYSVNSYKFIDDGLTIHMDASNNESYSGGTTWNDLKNNNSGTISGPNYILENGGVFSFDGINDGIRLIHNDNFVLTNKEPYTVSGWFYAENNPNQTLSVLFLHQRCNPPSIGFSINTLNGNLSFRSQFVKNPSPNDSIMYENDMRNKWMFLTGTYDGTYIRFYVNDMMVGENPQPANMVSYTDGGSQVWLGRRYPCADTNELKGKIGAFYWYKGKSLTHDEVISNYQTTKDRFNI